MNRQQSLKQQSLSSKTLITVIRGTTLDTHDDVIKWNHFPRYWPFVRGIHRSPVNSTHKASHAELWCFLWYAPWINGWVNNREPGDLRRHRAHYDVIVMRYVHVVVIDGVMFIVTVVHSGSKSSIGKWAVLPITCLNLSDRRCPANSYTHKFSEINSPKPRKANSRFNDPTRSLLQTWRLLT